jgi:hypothetical protein
VLASVSRRDFIHAAAASLLLPVDLKPCSACPVAAPKGLDYAFFDERFQAARRFAASWASPNQLIAVQGDITPLWNTELDRTTRERSLALRGMTTQSFQFCLRILAAEHAHVDVQASRIDRDLFLWTMRTTPKSDRGNMPWPSPFHRV